MHLGEAPARVVRGAGAGLEAVDEIRELATLAWIELKTYLAKEEDFRSRVLHIGTLESDEETRGRLVEAVDPAQAVRDPNNGATYGLVSGQEPIDAQSSRRSEGSSDPERLRTGLRG